MPTSAATLADAGGSAGRRPPATRVKELVAAPLGWVLEKALRCTSRRLGVAIVYHRVGDPAGDPATELVPSMGTALFRAQLALLRSAFDVVPAAQLAAAAAARRRFARFPVAITFDDDWAGHADVPLRLLREAGVPATFFLSGASLERAHDFWYERVQAAFDAGVEGPPEAIHAEAARVEALPPAERAAHVRALAERLGPVPAERGLRADAVRRLADAGHEIGFHTREHHALTTLDDAQLDAALRDSRHELEAAAGTPVRAIAYPSGKADARVVERARAAGFERGYSTMPHPVAAQSEPLWLGRVYPPPVPGRPLRFVLAKALLGAAGAAARPDSGVASG